MDSGASDHIAKDERYFYEIERLLTPVSIWLAESGREMKTEKKGKIRVLTSENKFCDLVDVLYVPTASANLLSLSRMSKPMVKITFEEEGFVAYKEGVPFLSDSKDGGLYRTDFRIVAVESSEKNSMAMMSSRPERWHRRLGHLNYRSDE